MEFHLHLLQPEERFLADFGCQAACPADAFSVDSSLAGAVQQPLLQVAHVRGRLKLCTKSLFLVPPTSRVFAPGTLPTSSAHNSCIVCIPLGDVVQIRAISVPPSHTPSTTCAFSLTTKSIVQIVAVDGRPRPYTTRRELMTFEIYLSYYSQQLQTLLDKIRNLSAACQMSTVQRRHRLAQLEVAYLEKTAFESSWLELRETIVLDLTGGRVIPLVSNPGRVVMTPQRILFQPFSNAGKKPVESYALSNITRVIPRRYTLRPVAVEIFYSGVSQTVPTFFYFDNEAARDLFLRALLTEYSKFTGGRASSVLDEPNSAATLRWTRGELSNYDYLMIVNGWAGRTVNDLSQYPVFPWILADYTSRQLDLTNEKTFRDLTRPIGALNPARLAMVMERYREMPEPKFMYGTHYSTPAYVLYFLVRRFPEYMLCLQNGQFDAPDRLFYSVAQTWAGVQSNQADVKELIPEFYEIPPSDDKDFLLNDRQIDFGRRQNGDRVHNVTLPPWATSAHDFHLKCRQALESEFVSARLHHWIDLVFGYKQRGVEAVSAFNVFHPMTMYGGNIDMEEMSMDDRMAMEVQIREFGQSPQQLWTEPHPKRLVLTPVKSDAQEPLESQTVASRPKAVTTQKWTIIARQVQLHRGPVGGMQLSDDGQTVYFTTADGFLKVYSLRMNAPLRQYSVKSLPLTTVSTVRTGTGRPTTAGSLSAKTAHPDLIACGHDGTLRVVSVQLGRTLAAHELSTDILLHRYLEGKNLVVTASSDGMILVGQLNSDSDWTLLAQWETESASLMCLDAFVALSDDGPVVILVGDDTGSVHCLEFDSGSITTRWMLKLNDGPVIELKLSPENGVVAVLCKGSKFVHVLDVLSGAQRSSCELFSPASHVTMGPVSMLAVCSEATGALNVFEWTTNKQLAASSLDTPVEITSLTCRSGPDGSIFIYATDNLGLLHTFSITRQS